MRGELRGAYGLIVASSTMERPNADSLADVVKALAGWQHDGAPVQLHPGDLGWHWRFGAEPLAETLRVWRRHGEILAVGFLDSPGLLRMADVTDFRRPN